MNIPSQKVVHSATNLFAQHKRIYSSLIIRSPTEKSSYVENFRSCLVESRSIPPSHSFLIVHHRQLHLLTFHAGTHMTYHVGAASSSARTLVARDTSTFRTSRRKVGSSCFKLWNEEPLWPVFVMTANAIDRARQIATILDESTFLIPSDYNGKSLLKFCSLLLVAFDCRRSYTLSVIFCIIFWLSKCKWK